MTVPAQTKPLQAARRRGARRLLAVTGLLPLAHRAKLEWFRLTDPRQLPELAGERVVFRTLETEGFLAGLAGTRILELGPKHGRDSALLAGLEPAELVLVDLPEKTPLLRDWLPAVEALCPTRHVEANLLYLPADERAALGSFDLVWCLGVVYHNLEQLRLLRRLYELCAPGGRVVVESSTVRPRALRDRNVVELHWPEPFNGVPTITHLPSRAALKSWLELVGFTEVELRDVYSRSVARKRAVLTARKLDDADVHLSYRRPGINPPYLPGGAE